MDDKPQADAATPAVDAPQTPPTAGSRGIGRRALLRGGAAAAPVLLTLHSGPVAAHGMMSCTVASSFVSLVTFASRNPGATTMQCSSGNADHWHSSAKQAGDLDAKHRPVWAKRLLKDYLGQASSVFSVIGDNPNTYQVWQVMRLQAAPARSGELGVLQHILGLALSIDAGGGAVNTGGVMNTPYLAGVWRNYKSTGGYKLAASHINWSEAELITWLRMLQYPLPVPRH